MASIRVEGVRQFTAALRRVDEKYPGQLRKNNLAVARDIATLSRREAGKHAENGIYRTSAKTIRAGAAGNSAIIRGGGTSTPYFWAAEYGGLRRSGWFAYGKYGRSTRRQWLPWRGNQWGGWDGGPGYMINPTIREHAAELIKEYERQLMELYAEAFPS